MYSHVWNILRLKYNKLYPVLEAGSVKSWMILSIFSIPLNIKDEEHPVRFHNHDPLIYTSDYQPRWLLWVWTVNWELLFNWMTTWLNMMLISFHLPKCFGKSLRDEEKSALYFCSCHESTSKWTALQSPLHCDCHSTFILLL